MKIKTKKQEIDNVMYEMWGKAKYDVDEIVKYSFDEILYAIYRTVEYKTPNLYDDTIDKIGDIVKEKLNVYDDDKINWQEIEEWYYYWCNSLTNILTPKEIENIFKTLKINTKEWEEPTAKIDIIDINNKIFEKIKENLEEHYSISKTDFINDFLEKDTK